MRGFPNWEQVGNPLKNDILYEGGAYFLFEIANSASQMHEEQQQRIAAQMKQSA